MKDVVSKLKKEPLHLESVYYRQDNAGCYHCGASITRASLIGKDTGVFVQRMISQIHKVVKALAIKRQPLSNRI